MEVSQQITSQMSAPTNNTTTYKIKTKHGEITAYIKSDEEHLEITLRYNDLATVVENSGKSNWKQTNIKLYIEIETVITELPIPEEIQYLTPQQLREMQK